MIEAELAAAGFAGVGSTVSLGVFRDYRGIRQTAEAGDVGETNRRVGRTQLPGKDRLLPGTRNLRADRTCLLPASVCTSGPALSTVTTNDQPRLQGN